MVGAHADHGGQKVDRLSGCSCASRLTRWSSVPTPQVEPAGAFSMVLMMNSVEPTKSAASTTCIMHSGWTRILHPGKPAPELLDMRGLEHLVDRAVALPEQDSADRDRRLGVSAQGLARVPDDHLVERNSHGPGGVPAQVLVGKEQDPASPGERPVQHGTRIGAGADDAAVPAAKRLQVGGRVDVSHRHQVARCR